MTTIGDRIRDTRKARDMTQGDLAKRVGLSQGTIGHIEAGRNDSSRYLVQIAAALGVRPEWLESGKGDATSTWPFPGVTPEQYAALPEADREDILAIVKLKVSRAEAERKTA